MRRVKRLPTVLLAAFAALIAVSLWVWLDGRSTSGEGDRDATQLPVAPEAGPRLLGSTGSTLEGGDALADTESWETPPAVYVQPEGPPPEPPVAMIIRVELPWGAVGERRLGGDMEGWDNSWFTPRWEMPPAKDTEGEPLWGRGDITGAIQLGPGAVAEWERRPLVLWAEGCRERVLNRPPNPLPPELEVRLEPDASPVRFRGRVVNERGEGLADAGVFLDRDWGVLPGVRTVADGAFDLHAPRMEAVVDPPPEESLDIAIVAVAPGHLATRTLCRASGQDDVHIVLRADTLHARLTIDFQRADGSPAAGARAWIYPAGEQFQAAIADGHVELGPTDDETETRRLLPRLVGGLSMDEQDLAIGHADGFFGRPQMGHEPPFLNDLVADDRGGLLLPAVVPGRYHLRAARADRTTAGRGAPEDGTLHVRETLDTEFEVFPPPATTHFTARLGAGRTIVGRVEVAANPKWHCGHRTEHRHWLHVDDWAWGGLGIMSGREENRGRTIHYSGAFRLDGVPRAPCTLRLTTLGHPELRIDLLEHPAHAAGEQDLGTIVVPDARNIQLRLLKADGSESRRGLWIWEPTFEGYPGAAAFKSAGTNGWFYVYTTTPPPAGAMIVVSAREGGRVLVRVPLPVAPDSTQPIEIRVPDIPPPLQENDRDGHDDAELGAE